MSSSNCCFLTCIQVSQEAGNAVWYSHLFKNFPQFVVITVKGFSVVSEAEIDVFLNLSCFFYDSGDVAIWSLVSLPFLNPACASQVLVHILLKPRLEDFEHDLASMWNECNWLVVWMFFGIALLWDWNENWPFPVLWPLLSFPNFLPYWVQHFHSIIFYGLKYFNWNSITATISVHSDSSKAHLTSHSRISGFRWVITPSWLSGSWRSLLYRSSVYCCHLLISFASVRSIPFLSFIEPIFAWNVSLVSLISWRDL